MNFKIFSIAAVSLVISCCSFHSQACGPFNPIIPTPDYFREENPKTMADYFKEENITLWQELTSTSIPRRDIEEVVYKDSSDEFWDYAYRGDVPTGNIMYAWLKNTGDNELVWFLSLAKGIEEKWNAKKSPWYHPRERDYSDSADEFEDEISACRANTDQRLKDRYSLQIVRCLFASRQYDRCIEYYDSVFHTYPDSNLMKRMAARYAAGCWRRLGEESKAAPMFAAVGDIWSLGADTCVDYMMRHNPGAPQIMEYVRANCVDSVKLARLVPVALNALKNKKVIHKGDWAYMLAYFYNEYANAPEQAARYIAQAGGLGFSSDRLRDLARAYRLKLDARKDNRSSLLAGLKWLETKCDVLMPSAHEWRRRTRNILYYDWIPRILKKKDYATAILMASYADHLDPTTDLTDYSSLSFQMMGSLTSAQLADVVTAMNGKAPLYAFLRKNGRRDADYYNELIGTLALREGNYDRGVVYLSKVSLPYQRSMAINKEGYLSRDPFTPAYLELDEETEGVNTEGWPYIRGTKPAKKDLRDNAKLDFARRMAGYQKQSKSARTADERSWARMMYAIGRYNSFNHCWALTQYWKGYVRTLFAPYLDYWDDDAVSEEYDFLYSYEKGDARREMAVWYQNEISKALAGMQSDEMRARAENLFGNVKTVIRKYAATDMALRVKGTCDKWQTWL